MKIKKRHLVKNSNQLSYLSGNNDDNKIHFPLSQQERFYKFCEIMSDILRHLLTNHKENGRHLESIEYIKNHQRRDFESIDVYRAYYCSFNDFIYYITQSIESKFWRLHDNEINYGIYTRTNLVELLSSVQYDHDLEFSRHLFRDTWKEILANDYHESELNLKIDIEELLSEFLNIA